VALFEKIRYLFPEREVVQECFNQVEAVVDYADGGDRGSCGGSQGVEMEMIEMSVIEEGVCVLNQLLNNRVPDFVTVLLTVCSKLPTCRLSLRVVLISRPFIDLESINIVSSIVFLIGG
jgi:hypothetical protein